METDQMDDGSTIHCDIVSAHRTVFSGPVRRFIATASTGEIGIYPHHAPLLTTLVPGPVRVLTPDDEETTFLVGGGILEVMPHVITLLADTAVRADDFDEAAALRARKEAERHLQDHSGRMNVAEAQAKLIELAEQLQALERLRRRMRRPNRG